MDLLNTTWEMLHDTSEWKKYSGSLRKIHRDQFASLRNHLRQARPFLVDNRALEIAYDLSLEGPAKVARRLMLARLPFPKVWFEIDFRHKVKLGEKHGASLAITDTTPHRVGWLLQEAPGDPHLWYTTTFIDNGDGEGSQMAPTSYMVDTLNRTPPSTIGPSIALPTSFFKGTVQVADGELTDEAVGFVRHLGWGYTSKEANDNSSLNESDMRQIGVPLELDGSINVALTPLTRAVESYTTPNTFKEMVLESLTESRGDVRLLVALLSLINEVPIVKSESRPQGTVRMGGRLKPYLQNATVTISLPTKRYKTAIRRMLKNAVVSAKARHEVRGHWRNILHKTDHKRKIKHPDGSIETIEIKAGEVEKVWVNSHERGDARLGYIKHNYSVEKR